MIHEGNDDGCVEREGADATPFGVRPASVVDGWDEPEVLPVPIRVFCGAADPTVVLLVFWLIDALEPLEVLAAPSASTTIVSA